MRRGLARAPGLPCLLPTVGPRPLPHHPGGSPRGSGCRERGSAGESGQAETARAKPQTRPSAPRPPRRPCSPGSGAATPMAQGCRQGGDRKGRGPIGGTHCTSHFSRDGGSGGGARAHFPHVCHPRPSEHGIPQIRTHVRLAPSRRRSCFIHVNPQSHAISSSSQLLPHCLPCAELIIMVTVTTAMSWNHAVCQALCYKVLYDPRLAYSSQ